MGESIVVGIGEIRCSCEPENVLIAPDLGAGICVCAYDPEAGVTAVAHIALPASSDGDTAVGRFADTAIPALVEQITEAGASPDRLRVAIVGGCELAGFRGTGPQLELGRRNAIAVKTALDSAKLPLIAADIGGSDGRTVLLTAAGHICVKPIGKRERDGINLGFTEIHGSRLG